MLDRLQRRGLLTWEFDYLDRRAIYWVAKSGSARKKLETKTAEALVIGICAEQGIKWFPVPQPGGKQQLTETLARIQGSSDGPPQTSTPKTSRTKIESIRFSIDEFPKLQHALADEPSQDRSLQIYRFAQKCKKSGLSAGETKWILKRYRPFFIKYPNMKAAKDELRRVVVRVFEIS